jgi:hypothetical protein
MSLMSPLGLMRDRDWEVKNVIDLVCYNLEDILKNIAAVERNLPRKAIALQGLVELILWAKNIFHSLLHYARSSKTRYG